jgi:cytochrome c biogenesis protein
MSVTFPDERITASPPPSKRKRSFPEQVWDCLACFRSVQLAIVLLSLLALATLAGVLLPQDGLVSVAEIKRQMGGNYRLFKAMGLFNVYSSYWFIALETLFFFNLLCGSFQWLKPAFLAATQVTFRSLRQIQAQHKQLAFTVALPPAEAALCVAQALKKARYGVHENPTIDEAEPQLQLYASKGNFSRLGPALAHIGILMMLVSSVYGVFFGFKAQQLAVPGQTFAIGSAQMFKPNIDADLWLGSTPDWKIRVDDFHIVYYGPGEAPVVGDSPNGPLPPTVKQYYANLSVVNAQGKTVRRETISVNHPLAVDDTVIYQASFSPTGKMFVEINGKLRPLQVNSRFMNRPVSLTELGGGKTLLVFPFFVQQDPNVTRNNAVFFIRDQKGFMGARPGKMPPNLRLREGESGEIGGMHLRYVRPEIATGLQIKKGPEIPWMYLSYLIIIVGTLMCIFSQRRLWVAVGSASTIQPNNAAADETSMASPAAPETVVRMAYLSNKAHISFMKELCRLAEQWQHDNGFTPLKLTEAEPLAAASASSTELQHNNGRQQAC